MAAAKRKESPVSGTELVAEAARRAYADANGDVREAARMLESAARSQSPLREALTEPLIAGACWDAVRGQVRETRRTIWQAPSVASGQAAKSEAVAAQSARVVQLAAGTLSMFPLPGGKRLGEATRQEIAEAAEFYAKQASDMSAKATWLRLVAQSIPAGRKAADVLTDERLAELQAEARRAH